MRMIEKNAAMTASLYKKSATILTVIAITAVLSACSARGQRFDPKLLDAVGDNSAIVVYRANQSLGRAYTAVILLDRKEMGRLSDGGWLGDAVTPGRHVIDIDKWFLESGGQHPTVIDTLPGQAYFIRYDQSAHAAGRAGGASSTVVWDSFKVVPREQALQELESLRESK